MGKGQKYKKCESRKSKNKYVIEKLEKKTGKMEKTNNGQSNKITKNKEQDKMTKYNNDKIKENDGKQEKTRRFSREGDKIREIRDVGGMIRKV